MKAGSSSPSKQMPWQMLPNAYLGNHPVTPNGRPEDCAIIDRTRRFLMMLNINEFSTRAAPWCPDLVFLTQGRGVLADIVVLRCTDSRLLGGSHKGLPYVFKPFRARGIGAEIVYFSDMHDGLGLSPGRYSESGMHGRMGAWRRHVVRALQSDPDSVPHHIKQLLC